MGFFVPLPSQYGLSTVLIKECESTVSSPIIINNELCGLHLHFSVSILCMDFLAQQLYRAFSMPNSGIGIELAPRAETILYLLFADDSLLFCKISSQAAFN